MVSRSYTHHFLRPLAEKLNIDFIDGTVLDPNAELLGIADPRFTLVNDYAKHPVGEAVKSVTLFPQAVALESIDTEGIWQAISLLQTPANTWSKAGLIDEEPEQKFHFEQGLDTAGPLSIAYLLSRKLADNDQLQRIAVIGDSDFVSNTYIGNGANLDLGLAIINWLSGDDALINIPTQTTLDNQLDLSKTHSIIIAFGFLIVIPLILFVTGFIIWQKRRQQ